MEFNFILVHGLTMQSSIVLSSWVEELAFILLSIQGEQVESGCRYTNYIEIRSSNSIARGYGFHLRYSMTAPLPSANNGVTSVQLCFQLQRSALTLEEEIFAVTIDSQSTSVDPMWCTSIMQPDWTIFSFPVTMSQLTKRRLRVCYREYPFTRSLRRWPF